MKKRAISIVTALAFAAALPLVSAPAQAAAPSRTVVAAAAPAPTPTTPVAITGNPKVGNVVHAVGATWPVPGTSTFLWTVNGTDACMGDWCPVMASYATLTMTLTETFVSDGNDTATTSSSVVVQKGEAPTPGVPLGILGTPRVGKSLSASGGDWSVAGDTSLAWSVDGTSVGTGETYVVKPADLGKTVKLTKTFTSHGYETATATKESGPVTTDAPTATTAPTISGKAMVGSTLTVVPATWPLTGTSTFEWSIGGWAVGTGTSYQLKPGDAGAQMTVTESFVSPFHDTAKASVQSATVADAPVSLTVKTGKAKKGKPVALTIRATSRGRTVSGEVKVTYGGWNLGTAKLKHGNAVVKLPAKSKGSYRLKVTYPGGSGFDRKTKVITVKVK
jgi:immune inhibitor A